jgi:WD40 repeat protein
MQTTGARYDLAVMSADGRLVAAWPKNGAVFPQPDTNVDVYSITTSNRLRVLPVSSGAVAAFSGDSSRLALGDQEKVTLWDTRTWQLRTTIPRSFSGTFGYVAFPRDARILAMANARDSVQLRETETGRELATLEPLDRLEITWIAFSPDGSKLAVVCSNGAIQLWDLRAIRQQLASMNIDWDLPPFPPVSQPQQEASGSM